MSNPPMQSPHTQVIVQQHQQPSNGLGIAGFITSLVGIVSCGLLSPIGLILSLIGLTKAPRGFAIAGAVIGAVGSVFLAFAGFAIVVAALGMGAAAKLIADYTAAHSSARQAYVEIDALRTQTGALPDAATLDRIAQKHTDPWGGMLKSEVNGSSLVIISAGRDKKFGTNDDLRFDEPELQSLKSTPPATLTEDPPAK